MGAQGRAATPASTGEAPHVLFLGHGAERTGPPILLGHLLAGLARERPWRQSVLVARDGPLTATYRQTATTEAVTAGREPLEPVTAALRRAGLGGAASDLAQRRRHQVARRIDAPDLVYVNSATPPTAALLRALDLAPAVPVIVHVHELDIGLRANLDADDRAALLGRGDLFIAASEPVARNLISGHRVDPNRLAVCPEFVDVASLAPLEPAEARQAMGVPAEATVVGSVGLPDWRKDPEHLLRAMARADPGRDTWIVWIGGDPASTDGRHLADEARRLGLADRFRHLVHQDDPTRLLRGIDVFALSAREDAMPLAALEAAGVGVPIVCFRTGGIADLCDDGAGDAIDYPDTAGFGDAIVGLLADHDRRRRIGDRAREIVRRDHDLAVGTARIAAVVDRALAGPTS